MLEVSQASKLQSFKAPELPSSKENLRPSIGPAHTEIGMEARMQDFRKLKVGEKRMN
jgi:hypothetical protein